MSKSKLNVAWMEGETLKWGFVSEEEAQGYLYHIGQNVVVRNDRILSNFTKGKISGFSLSASGNALAHVDWLDGAPPLRIRVEKLFVDRPKDVYILVSRNETVRDGIGFSTDDRYWGVQRGLSSRRYFTFEEASTEAQRLRRAYGHEVLILKTVGYCNSDGNILTIK